MAITWPHICDTSTLRISSSLFEEKEYVLAYVHPEGFQLIEVVDFATPLRRPGPTK